MFGLGVPELMFIMALALMVFGPKKLPQIGRTLGRGMAEFRKASTELQRSINMDLDEPPVRSPTASSKPTDSSNGSSVGEKQTVSTSEESSSTGSSDS